MSEIQNEILNIDYHKERMIVKALNLNEGNITEAAKDLGVSERSVYRYINDYKLFRSHDKKTYSTINLILEEHGTIKNS